MFEANSQNELLTPSQNPLEPPLQHSPEPRREQPRQGRGGLRTGAIIGLILLLIVVFVIGGFAGWVYAGTKSSSSGSTLNATTLDTQRCRARKRRGEGETDYRGGLCHPGKRGGTRLWGDRR